jgi:hypothetical protein
LIVAIEGTGKMPIPQEKIDVLWGRHPACPYGARPEENYVLWGRHPACPYGARFEVVKNSNEHFFKSFSCLLFSVSCLLLQ